MAVFQSTDPTSLFQSRSISGYCTEQSIWLRSNSCLCIFSIVVRDSLFLLILDRLSLQISILTPSILKKQSLSFLRRYYDTTTQYLYPYLTAIVDVRNGVVEGIAWDDACIFCHRDRCLPNTYNFDGSNATQEKISQPTNGCYFTRDECVALHAGGTNDCDLKLYVVWTGTDAQGRVLLSSDSRFSAFPPNRIQENVMSGVNSALGNLNDIKDKVTGTLTGAVDSVTGAVDAAGNSITGAADATADFFTGSG